MPVARRCTRGSLLLLALVFVCLLLTAGQAAEVLSSHLAAAAAAPGSAATVVTNTVVVTAATEQDAQTALNRHVASGILLHVILRPDRNRSNNGGRVLRLAKGLLVPKAAGPVFISSDDSSSDDSTGSSSSSTHLLLDCSKLPSSGTAAAIRVESQSAVKIQGLHITGCNNTLAIAAMDSGILNLFGMKFTKNVNKESGPRSRGYSAVSCQNCQRLAITDSMFAGNEARLGGAIIVRAAPGGMQLLNCTFEDNIAVSDAGAINAVNTPVFISGCTFDHQQAPTQGAWGGAINCAGGGIIIEHSRFTNCYSAANGGALSVFDAAAELTNVTCESTTAEVYGGCIFAGFSNVTVRDSLFYNNTANFIGGAMHGDRTTNLTAYNTTFHSNWAYYGGAINGQEEFDSGSVVLHDCLLENNTAVEKGGAVHAESQSFNFSATDTVFINNRVDKLGGAIACTTATCIFINCTLENNTADELGGALWSSAAVLLQFSSSNIFENQAPRGGGIYAEKADTVIVASSNIFNNTADIDGGGLTLLAAKNATMSGSVVQHNKAVVGAGIMLSSTGWIQISNSTIANNTAEKVDSKAVVVTTDGTVANAGSGAGIWGTQSTLELAAAVVRANQAERDGAGAYLLTCATSLIDSSFENNKAHTGNGGALYASMEAGLGISATRTTYAANTAGSGGAMYVTGPTSGMGYGSLSCEECRLSDNRATAEVPETAGGGGIMASGNVQLQLTNSQVASNAAPCGFGGAVQCLQCKALLIESTTAESNSAGKAGGAISCVRCGSTYLTGFTALSNTAAAGGALFLSITGPSGSEAADGRSPGSLGVFDSRFTSNLAQLRPQECAVTGSSGSTNKAGGDKTAAQAMSGAAVGFGGAIVVENRVPFLISGSVFEQNSADNDGGAVLHRACKGLDSCTLSIQDTTFTDNTALQGGGGALYTTNGSLLLLGNAAGDCQSNGDNQCAAAIHSSGNTAVYGADYTTSPSLLGLKTADMQELVNAADADASRLPKSLQAYVGEGSVSGAQTVLYLSSNKEFNLTILLLDLFGNQVLAAGSAQQADVSLKLVDFPEAAAAALGNSSNSNRRSCTHPSSATGSSSTGSGSSLCAIAGWPTEEQNGAAASAITAANQAVCAVGCLTGATIVAFDRGYANFTNVGLSAPPNSLLYMDIIPRGLDGISITRVLVRVQPCGVGEVLQQKANGEASCEACPVPLINLSPHTSDTCGECPAGADCLSGFMVPQQGFWHSHPRSANFLPCPSKLACAAADHGKLVTYQRVLKHEVQPEQNVVAFRKYMQAQCAETRDGPLCSSCAPGFALGPGAVCHKCVSSSRSASFIAFFVVRLLDTALVISLVLATMFLWQFSVEFTHCSESSTDPGSRHQLAVTAGRGVSRTDSASDAAGAKDTKDDAKNDVKNDATDAKGTLGKGKASKEGAGAATENKALVQLSLAVLVLLEWQQIGYLLFSTASPFMPRGASWLALLFLTPSSTLHWVPLGCVLPGVGSTAAAAVLSTVYPVLLAGAAGACLLRITSLCRRPTAATLYPINGQQQRQPAKASTMLLGTYLAKCLSLLQRHYACAAAELGTTGLLLLASAASLLYCVTDVTSAVASAFQCSALDSEPSEGGAALPGDTRAAVGFWWSRDLRLPCFSALHIAVAMTAGLIGIPLILGTVALLVFAIQKHAAADQRVATGRAQWHKIQQLRDDSAFSFSRSVLRLLSFKSAANKAPDLSGNSVQTLPEPKVEAAASGVQKALDMVGFMVCLPFASYAEWWFMLAVVWRIVLAAVVAVLGTAVGSSSVVMVGLAASALVAVLQLLHAAILPGGDVIESNRLLAGCYIGLQLMCLLLVVADAFATSVAAGAALYTLTAVVGSAMGLYFVYLAMSALRKCLSSSYNCRYAE